MSEDTLVEAARSIGFGELRRAVEAWTIAADPEGALEEEDRRLERRDLDVGPALASIHRRTLAVHPVERLKRRKGASHLG